jgi:cell division protein FtsQ
MQPLWRKRYVLAGWITLSAVSLVLLISAVKSKNSKVCKGINVEINGTGNNFFVDAKEVKKILTATGSIKGEAIANINLRLLESRLKKDHWIADAQLFFDNEEVLQVVVEEKDPVARVFTVGGSSFYIDTACNHLPLSNKLSARVPMFTGFPTDKVQLSKPDSALMASVKDLSMFIQADEFWKAQVAQVDMSPEGFVMIPTVGNHVVMLGKGEDYKAKFDRLFSFYKQVWTKVGFEKYGQIDVQYNGQVVATKRGASAVKVDSVKAKDALNSLLIKTKQASEVVQNEGSGKDNNADNGNVTVIVPRQESKAAGTSDKVGTRPVVANRKTEPPELKKAANVKVPKAIMKKPAK